MSRLPKYWVTVPLNELCDRIVDGSHNPPKATEVGWPMLSARNINNHQIVFDDYRLISEKDFWNENARTNVASGDVLLTIVGTIGRTAVIPDTIKSFALQRSVAVLKPRGVINKFLAYALDSPSSQKWLFENAKGTAQKGVYLAKLGTIQIPLAPEREQIRIVEKLEELLSDLDAGVAELKAAQKKLTQYRQSLLKAAVEGRLTAEWRAKHPLSPNPSPTRGEGNQVLGEGEVESENSTPLPPRGGGAGGEGDKITGETGAQLLERILAERRRRWEKKQLAKFKEQGKIPPKDWRDKYPEPVKPNTAGLPELPEEWVWATVDQLALEMKYGSSAKTSAESGSIPVLRMGNIQDGELNTQDLKFLSANHDEFPSLILQDGDLLFNRTNSPELVGKTAIYRSQITPCSYASYLIAVRFSPSFFPEFASAYINSIYGRLWVKSVVTQQVGQANVNGSKLAALAIPLPPYQEQIEIVRLLLEQRRSSFEQSKAIEYGLKQSSAQRQNILKAAFSGQLVPQDPNDEPASVLLERIRVERAAQESGGRRRGRKTKEGAA